MHHLSQLDRPLTVREESGDLSRRLGLLPQRQHMTSHQRSVPNSSVMFVHPLPSAKRPWQTVR